MAGISIVVFVVTKDNASAATTAATADDDADADADADADDDDDAVFLIKIEIDQGVLEVGVVFATAAKVTKIDSMTLIGDDDG